MANNYDHFAETMPVTAEEEAWIRKVLEPIDADDEEDYLLLLENEFDVHPTEAPDEDWPQFEWAINDGEMLLTCGEHFNGDHIQWFMQAFLEKFKSGQTFRMTWAGTCDKPRPGEFGGGWCVMTQDDAVWGSSWDQVRKLENRFLGKDLWQDNEIQFARMICELMAMSNQVTMVDAVMASMDLDKPKVLEIINRAEEIWEEAKDRTRKHQAWAAAQKEK